MTSMMNKARDFLGWGQPMDDEYTGYDETFGEEFTEAEVVNFQPREEETHVVSAPRPAPVASVTAVDQSMRIETVHPSSYPDARIVGEFFRQGIPVIVNLTDLPEAEAQRVLDFVGGLTFGLEGSADRVTNRVFLLTPRHVQATDHSARSHVRR